MMENGNFRPFVFESTLTEEYHMFPLIELSQVLKRIVVPPVEEFNYSWPKKQQPANDHTK